MHKRIQWAPSRTWSFTSGSVEIVVGDNRHTLMAGDAIQFEADVHHEYRNAVAAETVIHLVKTYAGRLEYSLE